MTPNEKNLEKLIRKIVKQQPVNSSEVFSHWKGLSDRGDRVVINTLNRLTGWEAFVIWSESESEARDLLKRISNRAGISEAGVLILKASGFAAEEDSERSQALWILQTVRSRKKSDWTQAVESMLRNEDFFEGTLSLLETEETAATAEFLSFLTPSLNRDQDQAVRKALYRLRQKGIEAPEEPKETSFSLETERTEIFLLAENRLPLWQPFFYFSGKGARGDWFFAEINEGKTFDIVQQQRNVRMNLKEMTRIANNYAAHFQQGTGVQMAFHAIPAMHARYFIEKSFDHLHGAEEFRRYMGEGEREDPFRDWNDLPAADAQSLFNSEFFILWMLEEDFLKRLFARLNETEEGPIILPEQQRREQKAEIVDQSLLEYFSPQRRQIWSLSLQKAAYAFQSTEPELAKTAIAISRLLSDPEKEIRSIPFASLLLERSLEVFEKQQAKQKSEEKKTSLIMTPQEFERSLKK